MFDCSDSEVILILRSFQGRILVEVKSASTSGPFPVNLRSNYGHIWVKSRSNFSFIGMVPCWTREVVKCEL